MPQPGNRRSHGRSCALLLLAVVLASAHPVAAVGPPAGVSSKEWSSIQAQLEAERHKVVDSDHPGKLFRADNPAQRFTTHFGAEDVAIEPSGRGESAWHLGLRLTAWGAADDLKQVEFAHATAEENRVEYHRGPLTEWYANTAMGLEQGFTIEAPPGDDIDELVLEMTIESDLTAEVAESAEAIIFRHEDTNTTLTYSALKAWDAVQKPLEARMELAGGGTRLRLVVGVTRVAWPIVVDPVFAQTDKLLPKPELDASGSNFGQCVAIDGDLMVVGMRDPSQGEEAGSAHLYRRDPDDPTGWIPITKLLPIDGAAYDYFGWPVDISGDTVVVGAQRDDVIGVDSGSAYVFEPDATIPDTWYQVAKLIPDDGAEEDRFGHMVSISGDTVLVSAVFDDDHGTDSGSAYIFQRDQGGENTWGEVTKITASDGTAGDYFGNFASIDGDTVVVGASLDDDHGDSSGSAYVFERDHGGTNTWGQVTKITTADVGENDWFGFSTDIHEDVLVVGAPGYYESDHPGAAFVFLRDHGGPDSWEQVAELVPADGQSADRFGNWLSVEGDTIVVGAFGDDDNGSYSGSAYVFQRDQGGPGLWGQVSKITAPDGEAEDYFGSRVSMSGDTAILGAWGDDDEGPESGSVYTFERNQGETNDWGFVGKLTCPEVFHARHELFGGSVDIYGDTAVVSAYGDNENGAESGSAYIFRRGSGTRETWAAVAKIIPDDGTAVDHFGYSVSVSGDTVVVGAYGDDDNGSSSGSAYVFQRDQGGPHSWGQVAKITPFDGGEHDRFGNAVAIDGVTVVIGAPYDDNQGDQTGSAYIFQRDLGGPNAWGQVAKIIPADGAHADRFGRSVTVANDVAVIGADGDDDNGGSSGSSYIYYRDQGGSDAWGQVAKIKANDAAAEDFFGTSVSVAGDTLIVGAPGDDDYGSRSGSAYVFRRNHGGPDAWGQVVKIHAADGAHGDQYGFSVGLINNTAVVGAFGDDGVGLSTGSAYIHNRDHTGLEAWGQIGKLASSDGGILDEFGFSASLNGESVIVGAPKHQSYGEDSGAAYIFTISDAFFVDGFETGDTSGWSATVP